LVNSINPEEIAKAALEILTQEEKRMEVVKKGLSRVSQFDWDAAAKKTIRIYESMGTS